MINISEKWFKFYTFTRFFVVAVYVVFSCCLLHGYVYDVEYIGPEKRYELERSVFNANNSPNEWSRDFPSYGEWSAQQEAKYEAMKESFWEGIVAASCTHKEYEEYVAERAAARDKASYPNLGLDQDRSAPDYASCPQAMERKD